MVELIAEMWSGLNYARLIQWRGSKHVDFKGTEHEFYHCIRCESWASD